MTKRIGKIPRKKLPKKQPFAPRQRGRRHSRAEEGVAERISAPGPFSHLGKGRAHRVSSGNSLEKNDSSHVRHEPREKNQRILEPLTVPMLVERVQAEREQLFKAIAIVELCRLSTASLLEIIDSESMVPVFEATCDLLNTSAERLEWIASDLQELSRKDRA